MVHVQVQVQVSVIVPTHNRAQRLRACLRALCRQSMPPSEYEIIVVVDGSTDATAAIPAEFAGGPPIRTVCQPRQGPGAARNRGAAEARGRTCLFVDDDIVADAHLVETHARLHQQQSGVIGVGRIDTIPVDSHDGFAACLAGWLRAGYAQIERGARPASFLDAYSGNLSVARDAFLSAGGFDADLPRYEDIELGYRLVGRGMRLVYLQQARGAEQFDKKFAAIARDAERAGAASIKLYQRHPALLGALKLGEFAAAPLRVVLARRLLLRMGLPLRVLGLADAFAGTRWSERWYSFVYDYCYWRGVRSAVDADADLWQRLTQSFLILNYHAFAEASQHAGRFIMPWRRFARQMRWLRAAGFRVASLESLLQERADGGLVGARSVAITIDDGYADNERAWSILESLRLPSTLFVVTDAVGGTNTWDADGELAGRPLLTWSTLRRMGASGLMRVGAHTRTHAALPALSPDQARTELQQSRDVLEQQLDDSVSTLAYPFGAHTPAVEQLARDVGFGGACGADAGPNLPRISSYALRRTEVRGTDSLLRFILTLWFGELPRRASKVQPT